MLEFLKRRRKQPADPFADAASANRWLDEVIEQNGTEAHDAVARLVQGWHEQSVQLSSSALDAVFVFHERTSGLHEQLLGSVLLNSRMPPVLEAELRARCLAWADAFLTIMQRLGALAPGVLQGRDLQKYLPRAEVLQLQLLGEKARWCYLRQQQPDAAFWHEVHGIYSRAEQRGTHGQEVALVFEGSSTVEDQYLILAMLALLANGSLSPLQLDAAWHVLQELSNRMTLSRSAGYGKSFAVELDRDRPPVRAGMISSSSARYWSTEELVQQLGEWLGQLESGQGISGGRLWRGLDAGLIRLMMRCWAPQDVRHERAARSIVDGEVMLVHRLSTIHRVVREHDEQSSRGEADDPRGGFDQAVDLRVYGFVTQRPVEREASALPVDSSPPVWVKGRVDNVSETGLGVFVAGDGLDWLAIGRLVAYRENEADSWRLGIVRRMRRDEDERFFLGVECIAKQPLAAVLRSANQRIVDQGIPEEQVWRNGLIGLFAPTEGREHRLLMPSAWSVPDRMFHMEVRGKTFQITLGRAVETGSDWSWVVIGDARPLD